MAKILIVEDEYIVSLELQQRIRDLGYEVAGIADNGDAAIIMVTETKPDLILMDINIKGYIDGIETSRQILQKYNVPIIYLTAYSDKTTLERVKSTSPYGYVIKPIDERELHVAIEISLNNFQMEKKVRESEKRLSIILQSIGDGVIATDEKSRITHMNRTAESMCGWPYEEAKGFPLNRVFNIKSAITQNLLNNPVEEVFRTGKVIEMVNHTVLIARDGTERNISDSAAPIRDDSGEIQGVVLVFSDVTESYKNRELLKQSEKLHREVIENASDIIYMIDQTGRFIHANAAALKLTGYTKEEVENRNFLDVVAPEHKERVKRRYFRQFLAKMSTTYTEIPIIHRNGKISWFGQNVTLVMHDGIVTGFHVISRDITDRKKAEDALRKNEEMLRLIIDIIPDRIFVKDVEGKFILNNISHLRALGAKTQEEALGKTDFDFRSEEKSSTYQAQDKKVVETKIPLINYNQRDIKENGDEIWLQVSKLPFRTSDGNIIGTVGISRDITEQKIAELEIRMLANALKSINECVSITDLNNRLTFVNQSFLSTYGYREEELIGQNISILGSPNNPPGIDSEVLNDTLRGGWQGELLNRKKDGTEFPIHLSTTNIYDDNNMPMALIGVASDITLRKLHDAELRKLNQVVVQSPASIIITDLNAKIVYVNPKAVETTGYSKEELLGENPRILSSGEFSREWYSTLWDTLTSGKEWRGEFHNKKKNGELYWEFESISPIRNESGTITQYMAIKEEITERKKLEIGLIEAKEKAEAASELKDAFIANISHEIRTPLNGVLGMTSIIKDVFSDFITSKEEELFLAIDRSSKRIIRTVDMILNFSRLQVGDFKSIPRTFDLGELLYDLYQEFNILARQKGLVLTFENKIGKRMIHSDSYCLNQVVSNLMDNAIKYTEIGSIKIVLYADYKDKIKIDIQDTGVGISEDYMDQLFKPYSQEEFGYTRAYEGVGLGLSLVKKFLLLINAEISVKSKKSAGSVFTITFAQSTYPADDMGMKIFRDEASIAGSGRKNNNGINPSILIVEDEEINQLFLSVKLKKSYRVIIAENAIKALEALESQHFDIILMDISLKGGLNGIELTRILRETNEYNTIPIIAVTGHAFDRDKDRCLAAGCNDYISKPFKIEELEEKIIQYLTVE